MTNEIEHPEITKTILTGYPKAITKDDDELLDVFDDEIVEGEEYYMIEGFAVKKENLLMFVENHFDFHRETRGRE
jgi:hypothetical protein